MADIKKRIEEIQAEIDSTRLERDRLRRQIRDKDHSLDKLYGALGECKRLQEEG